MPTPDDTTAYVLSNSDVTLLKQIRDDLARKVKPVRSILEGGHELVKTQDIFVAKTPGVGTAVGIPALSGNTPGAAMCLIYKLVPDTATIVLLETGRQEVVYNLSPTSIPSHTYILIKRDKFGTYWVEGSMSGITGLTGTYTIVTAVSCSGSPPVLTVVTKNFTFTNGVLTAVV
jgi:hypothetical protein